MQRIGISTMVSDDEKLVALSLRNLSCYWDFTAINRSDSNDDSRVLALDNINVDLRMNELTCVIGSVGSGKTGMFCCDVVLYYVFSLISEFLNNNFIS